VDARRSAEAYSQRHGDLFQRGIPRTFSEPVHRNIGTLGPGFKGCQRVGRCHAEIIMSVESEREVGHASAETRHGRVRLEGAPHADRVGKAKPVDPRSPRGPGALGDETRIGARRILGTRGHETEVPARVFRDLAQPRDDPRLGPA